MRTAVMAAVAATLAGCDSRNDCFDAARAYQEAMPAARVCQPVGDACSAPRPLVVSRQEPDGTLVLEGLCSTAICAAGVNPDRTDELDRHLGRYLEAGCELGACWCPIRGQIAEAHCGDDGFCSGLIWP